MPTFHIHIEGQVQGVGFRPYVFRVAKALGIVGTVSNGLDGVHIHFDTAGLPAQEFYLEILRNAPKRARILRHSMKPAPAYHFDSFAIIESEKEGTANLLLTPDLGLCDECKMDIQDAANRRNQYAFTTCIHCGPRYSIIKSLPYDRVRTTMDVFEMCEECRREYDSPDTRRHFSQTNSCPACPVNLQFYLKDKNGQFVQEGVKNDWRQVISSLEKGQTVAVKGIGGYLLICDATNPTAISLLRERKHRPTKPFALMYPDLPTLEKDALLSDKEIVEFHSIESPIVLCKMKKKPASGLCKEEIAPGLGRVGAMQPYTPLFQMLLSEWEKPIIATSGNLSGSPIFFEDIKAMKNFGDFADAFLTNDREILLPQDDSVVQYSTIHKQRIVLRRSRGFAPTYIHFNFGAYLNNALAMGADMKSAFALQHAGNTYISQYLGDLESFDTQENYDKTVKHLLQLLSIKPEKVLIDEHPGYYSAAKGKELAGLLNIPATAFQHHRAHFAAVLAENEMLETEEKVLGVIWDGLGWGYDGVNGNFWGGEFFSFQCGQMERIAHFDYFPLLMGDKMSREPRLSALAICQNLPEAEPLLRTMFSTTEWNFYQKIMKQPSQWMTSSVGRLFDAVAALLGLRTVSTYEGEAAMYLETLAASWAGKRDFPLKLSEPEIFSTSNIAQQIIYDLKTGIEKAEIAFKFHKTLAKVVRVTASKAATTKIAFSGGVFQNAFLIDCLIEEMKDDFDLYFHRDLSPNDECIALGQLTLDYLITKSVKR